MVSVCAHRQSGSLQACTHQVAVEWPLHHLTPQSISVLMRDARDHPHMLRLSWRPVNAWPFCSVWLMVRGSTSTFTTWCFSYEETRGKHSHTLRHESALYPWCPLVQRRQGISDLLCVACGFHSSLHVSVCLSSHPAAKALGTTKTIAVHVVLEGMRHPAGSPSFAPSQRNGATHNVSNCFCHILRGAVPFCLVTRWCEADGVTEAGDDKHAYHQQQ